MSDTTQVRVRVTRRFDASPERVFDAWLDPDLIGRWLFGLTPHDEEMVRIAIDPRVGGTFSFIVRRQGVEIDHIGEYLEIDRPRRLAFTWGVGPDTPDSRVFIDIVPLETGTELTLTHELHPDWADFASRTEAGWTTILNAIATTLG